MLQCCFDEKVGNHECFTETKSWQPLTPAVDTSCLVFQKSPTSMKGASAEECRHTRLDVWIEAGEFRSANVISKKRAKPLVVLK